MLYVIAHADIPDLIAESAFLKHFNAMFLNAFGETIYLSTSFISAVTSLVKDLVKDDNQTFMQSVRPCEIYTSSVSSKK